MKPRILVLENSVAVTGALKAIVRNSCLLNEQFEFVFVIPLNSKARNYISSKGFEVLEMIMIEIRRNLISIILYIPLLFWNALRLSRMVKKNKINLIISNDFYNLIPAAYRLFGGRVQYVCYIRFRPSKFLAWLKVCWLYAHKFFSSKIIAVSQVVLEEIRPVLPNAEMIYDGFSSAVRPTNTSRFKRILYPANYIQGKGQEFALESFAKVAHKYPDWKLRFVGGDMGLAKNLLFKKELIERAIILKIMEHVEFMNFSEEMESEYLESSIVLNFSDSESFSLTCIEAMYFGNALMATRSGGPQEIIDDEVTGLLVGVGDLPEMILKLERLLKNESLRSNLGKKAAEQIRLRFNDKKLCMRLEAIIQSVLTSMHSNP